MQVGEFIPFKGGLYRPLLPFVCAPPQGWHDQKSGTGKTGADQNKKETRYGVSARIRDDRSRLWKIS